MIRVERELSREWPEEWWTLLRALSPDDLGISYLHPRWVPARKVTQVGCVDTGRWVLYEHIPRWGIREDIVRMLEGPPPRLLPDDRRVGRALFVDDYAHEVYRVRQEWARPFWVLQGPNGGHPIAYTDTEAQLRQAMGKPTSPPRVGQLPYAPFDGRVCRKILERDRLMQADRNLDTLRKLALPDAIQAEYDQAQQQFRADYVRWLEDELVEGNEFLDRYYTKTEARETLRPATKAEENAAARVKDEFIATGLVPAA